MLSETFCFSHNDLVRLHFRDRRDDLSFDMRQRHVLESLNFALNNPIQLCLGG